MRVLIVLSAALAIASASVATVYTQQAVPVAYTTSVEPKSSYEYQASVQTEDYNNFQSVKSVDPAHGDINTPLTAVKAEAQTIYAEQPAVIAARTQNVVLAQPQTVYHAQPSVVVAQPQTVYTEAAAPAVIAARTVYDATPIVEQSHFVEAAPALQPVIRPIVRTHSPLIKTIQPTTYIASEPVVAVKTADPTIYAERLETPIVEVEQRPAVAVNENLLTVKSQYHSQDELGRAAYGHAEPTQSHNAYQDETGAKTGSFSYIAPNGRLLTTNYVADENGYRAATNALPVHEVPAVHHNRRRRSIGAVALAAPAPIITKVAPYSYSTYRIDGYNTLRSAYPVNSVYTHTAPLAYSAVPTVYSAQPAVYSVPALPSYRAATLTNIVHNPGHAASYRVD